jgi:hypothetical protein
MEEQPQQQYRTITQMWETLLEQDPRFKMVVDLATPRGNRKNVMPLTRENVRIAFAAFNDEVAEQLTDLALNCFSHSHSPKFITTDEGEEYILTNEEEVYYQWDPEAALRICNQRLDGFLIEISDRGTITRFKYERPPFLYPHGWKYEPTTPETPDDDLCTLFDRRSHARRRRRFGNVGDKYDLHGKAWKRG